MTESDCIFCNILKGQTEASYVAINSEVAVFMDLFPLGRGHALIVPKQHTAYLDDLSDNLLAKMMTTAAVVGKAMMDAPELNCHGYNLLLARGSAAGQEVFHAHLHVIGRINGDGLAFRTREGKSPIMADRAELDNVAETISAEFLSAISFPDTYDKIETIKALSKAFSLSLKETKDRVDEVWGSGTPLIFKGLQPAAARTLLERGFTIRCAHGSDSEEVA